MAVTRDVEIKKNFDYFQSVVSELMADHAGRYALLRDRSIVAFYDKPADAMMGGMAQFEDGLFSVQRVTDRPLDLGFLSYGSDERRPH